MKVFLTFFLMVFFSIHLYGTSFVFGESIDVDDRAQLIGLILDNSDYCLTDVSEGKIFLKPDKIYPTNEGCFLRINHFDLVRLPKVYSNERGCFLDILGQDY